MKDNSELSEDPSNPGKNTELWKCVKQDKKTEVSKADIIKKVFPL